MPRLMKKGSAPTADTPSHASATITKPSLAKMTWLPGRLSTTISVPTHSATPMVIRKAAAQSSR